MVGLLNRNKSNLAGGFSLVEVAMSLAIVGFTCIALIGMLPMGLVSFHQAMGNTIEADIVQNLSNDMLLANFSDLYQYDYNNSTNPANQTFYYDAEGTQISTTTPTVVPTGAVYTAVVTITPISNSGASATTSYPAQLTVMAANNGISKYAPSDTTWSSEFSGGITSAYNVTITIASSPSALTYSSGTYSSVAQYLSQYATNTGSAQAQTTHTPDQYSFVIANNNQ